MTRSRARVEHLVPGLLTLFLVSSSVPRSVLFVHRHAGNGHEHVHAWGEDASAPTHRHRPRVSHGVEVAGPDEGWHAHVQSPFQVSDAPAVASATRADALLPLAAPASRSVSHARLRSQPARAPPAGPSR